MLVDRLRLARVVRMAAQVSADERAQAVVVADALIDHLLLARLGQPPQPLEAEEQLVACGRVIRLDGEGALEGGDRGGRVVVAGPPEAVAACGQSYTGQFLRPLLERR